MLDQREAGQRDPIDPNERTPAQQALIRQAVEAERGRVRPKRMAEPLTDRGREMKRPLDLPTSLIRKQERRLARAVLKGKNVPKDWLAARRAELLPIPYFHVVFTVPTR